MHQAVGRTLDKVFWVQDVELPEAVSVKRLLTCSAYVHVGVATLAAAPTSLVEQEASPQG